MRGRRRFRDHATGDRSWPNDLVRMALMGTASIRSDRPARVVLMGTASIRSDRPARVVLMGTASIRPDRRRNPDQPRAPNVALGCARAELEGALRAGMGLAWSRFCLGFHTIMALLGCGRWARRPISETALAVAIRIGAYGLGIWYRAIPRALRAFPCGCPVPRSSVCFCGCPEPGRRCGRTGRRG